MNNHRMYLALGAYFIAIDVPGDTPYEASQALDPFLKREVLITPDTTPVALIRGKAGEQMLREAREAYEESLEALMKARLAKEQIDADVTTAQIWEDAAMPPAPEESPVTGDALDDDLAELLLVDDPKDGAPSVNEPDTTAYDVNPEAQAIFEQIEESRKHPEDLMPRPGHTPGKSFIGLMGRIADTANLIPVEFNEESRQFEPKHLTPEELEAQRENVRRLQAETLHDASMSHTQWTQGEDRTIQQDFHNKVPITATAQKLGRTYFAVSRRRSVIGAVQDRRNGAKRKGSNKK